MAMQHTFFQHAWSSPKQGNTSAENEDAWRTVCTQQADASTLLLVVADGATEGVYSRTWARTLVEAVTPEWPLLSDAELTARLQQLRQSYQPLPPDQEMAWNVKTKLMTEGSCATLLAATVTTSEEDDSVELQAVAVGDCCLLVLRADASLGCAFPLATAAEFNTSPVLVRSLFQPQLEYRRLPPLRLQVGDVVLVCTDAVGKWALECVEGKALPLLIKMLLGLLAAETTERVTDAPAAAPFVRASNDAPSHRAEGVVETKEEDASVTRLRIIPRWKVPHFVQAWFPKKLAAPTPVNMVAPKESPLSTPPTTNPQIAEHDIASVPASPPPTTFAQWVAEAQAADSEPRLKNDDATLVLCMPVLKTDAPPLSQAQELLRRYQQALAR